MLADLPPDFELDHLALALEYVTDFRCAVDGGACTGIWTREMAKRFERVIAFEPVPENADRIEPAANVVIEPYGLGNRRGSSITFVPGEDNIGCWHVEASTDDLTSPMIAADVVRLDDLRGLDHVGFVKLDVEGYELFALQGATETIKRCKPVLCIEEKHHCLRYGVEMGAATRYLEGMGMHVAARIGRDVILVW